MINVVDDSNSQTNRDIEIGGWSNIESTLHQERRILFKKMFSEVKQYHAAFEKMAYVRLSAEACLCTLFSKTKRLWIDC